MTTTDPHIDAFLTALRSTLARFAADDSAVGTEVRRILAVWPDAPTPGHRASPQGSPVAAHLAAALALAEQGDASSLAATIPPLAPWLSWTFGYAPHPQYPDLESRVAFAQFVGPRDLGHAEHLLMGLTLLAPHTVYPAHMHPANELYLPLGGTGIWSQGGGAPAPEAPGSVIFHPSGVAHTTESLRDPVLALYIWRGDLSSPSVFLADA
ncbi:hypothetical protein IMZ29_04010 [Achromobacter sp. GG226]|uniref:dimethylsulfonioproprionate lyase family protein n=1 Tax=Verticiella alkaliphila TaxID=2779529 RepID=UPI001C0CCC62|nr:dimethylsulfonioproprionate lyase family protein [Verticiella sp. GG226]MBU4609742.1 hypothetical protein [Verticiella sp. GG226]